MLFFKKKSKPKMLTFLTPAKDITTALPCGNGSTAVFVEGGVGEDTLLVLSQGVFAKAGAKSNNFSTPVDAKSNLSSIKRNLAKGNTLEAQEVISNSLNSSKFAQNNAFSMPLCQFVLKFNSGSVPFDYSRTICLDEGCVDVTFSHKFGTISRQTFVSTDGIICHKVESENSTIDCDIALVAPKVVLPAGFENCKTSYQTQFDGDFATFTAQIDGEKHGIVALFLSENGKFLPMDNYLKIKDTKRFYIFAKTFSNASNFQEKIEEIKQELKSSPKTFEKLKKEFALDFSQKMNCTLLNFSKNSMQSVEGELLNLKTNELSTELLQNLYYYGKYLHITLGKIASSCDCLFANEVQNLCFNSPFDYEKTNQCFLISSENYLKNLRLMRFCLNCGLHEDVKNYLQSVFAHVDDYKANALNLFNCEGAFVPSVTSANGGQIGASSSDVVLNKGVMPSIVSLCYEYYLSTNDSSFMKDEAFPFLRELGIFYENFFKQNKTSKMLESPFGMSGFSTPKGSKSFISPNTTEDFESAKFVFNVLSSLAKDFSEDEKESKKWQMLSSKIPDVEVDKNGIVKVYNINDFETDNTQSGISHLFPYNIGFRAFNAKRDFETLIANTAKFRFASAFGNFHARDLCDIALCLATCGDGVSAFEVLQVLSRVFANENLMFSSCDKSNLGLGKSRENSFVNIDANTSICATIQNMFATTFGREVYLFKNLPKRLSRVTIKNLILPNSLSVSMEINNKKGVAKLKFLSVKDDSFDLFLPDTYKKHKGCEAQANRQDLSIKNISIKKDKPLKLKIFY